MATKKKPKSNRVMAKKAAKKAVITRLAKGKITPRSAKKKAVPKKAVAKKKARGTKAAGAKAASALRKNVRGKDQGSSTPSFPPERLGEQSGGQSGDLQGLSKIEEADSESVAELIEEGNAFEADAVTGVENADDADEREVRTHEVPEDDVPGEYLDKE